VLGFSSELLLVGLAAVSTADHIPLCYGLAAAMATHSAVSALIPASAYVTSGACLLIHSRAVFTDRSNVALFLFSTSTVFIAGLRSTNCFF
jgi:NADH:ubiquinone oxidoreductase subunit 5 (subunit L)/multisubunit Na+/H+ antiporter MnhA subunit